MKKLLALLTALTLALSLFAVAPVMATGEEGEAVTPELTIYEQIRKSTNKVINGDLEADEFKSEAGTGSYCYRGANDYSNLHYEVSGKESYSGNKSLYQYKTNGNGAYVAALVSGIRNNATYIASAMVLSTQANKAHSDSYAGYYDTWGSYFRFDRDSIGAQGGQAPGVVTLGEAELRKVRDVAHTAAAFSDKEGARSPKSAWQRYYTTMTVGEGAFGGLACGFNFSMQTTGLTPEKCYLEAYVDDYYLGELMVADIVLENGTTINVPAASSVTVELDAQAYNQVENTFGLENADYTYELVGNPDGAYITNDGKLLVTSAANAGTLTVKVTCEPKFFGADTQEAAGVDTSYRTKSIDLTIVKDSESDLFTNIRNSTNKLGASKDFDSKADGDTPDFHAQGYIGYPSSCKNEYTISSNKAYNSSKSLFVKVPENALSEEARVITGALSKGKTYVASAMVLGTANNAEAIAANPGANLNMTFAGFFAGGYAQFFKFGESQYSDGTSTGNSVSLSSINDDWQMVHACGYLPSNNTAQLYASGVGILSSAKNIEYYADDFYAGELVVAKVDTTDTIKKAMIGEVSEIELKATAYNQLGTSDYFGEGSEYIWEAVSLPAGVEVDGNELVIGENAEAGKAVVNVTFKPTFAGEADQTAEQKAARTATVIISITEKPGFKYDASTGVVTAVVGTLDNDAKAYCALYKVLEGGAKKLMSVESKDVVAGGENVAFTAITAPEYAYEIKCFMWYESNPMKNVINAVVYPQ